MSATLPGIVPPSADNGITFTIYGVPIPKGSTRAFVPKGWKRPIVTADNTKTKPWQEAIVAAARDVLKDAPPMEGPVELVVAFFLPRPKSAPRRVVDHTKKPDLDKLLRCVKDGLTRAGVYRDDAQVVCIGATKAFAGGADDSDGEKGIPRAELAVSEVRGGGILSGRDVWPPGCPKPVE